MAANSIEDMFRRLGDDESRSNQIPSEASRSSSRRVSLRELDRVIHTIHNCSYMYDKSSLCRCFEPQTRTLSGPPSTGAAITHGRHSLLLHRPIIDKSLQQSLIVQLFK